MQQLFNIELNKISSSKKKDWKEKKFELFLKGGLPNKKMKIGSLAILI